MPETETKTIALVTRAGVEDRNRRTYTPEACRRIVELVNQVGEPGLPVSAAYPKNYGEIQLHEIVGFVERRSASFDGERIHVRVRILDTPRAAEAWEAYHANGVHIGTAIVAEISPAGLVYGVESVSCLAMFRDDAPAVPALVGHKGDQEFSTGVLMACPRCGVLGTLGKFTCCTGA